MTADAKARRTPLPAAKTVVLLIGCAFCVNSLAASNSLVECDELSQDPQNLDLPTQKLIASKTDHFLVPPADALVESRALTDTDPKTIAPILSLTPRVSNILDRVFAIDAAASRLPEADKGESALSVADHVKSESDAGELEDNELPKIQQQMYRKDI